VSGELAVGEAVDLSLRETAGWMNNQTVKVKQSRYRPWQALRVPGGWGSQISRQSAHEGGKIVSPTHRPPLLPRKYSWYSCLLQAESAPRAIMWPEGLCQWKTPMTPSGIGPATYRLVAQCINQLRPPRASILDVWYGDMKILK